MNDIITAKKLPDAQRYYVIGSRDYEAFLQFSGSWLSDAGFIPGTIATVSTANGFIVITVWSDTAATYGDVVKLARTYRHQIIQTQKNRHVTVLDIHGYILGRAGFGKGDISGVRYDDGVITLFKPDLRRLGL